MEKYRILIVDDMPSIHQDFRKILEFEKKSFDNAMETVNALLSFQKTENSHLPEFELESAYQASEAVALVEKSLEENYSFSVAFIDVLMPPGADGIETIEKIWKIDPNIQIVLCTAYSKYSWEDLIKRFGMTDSLFILKKPFDTIEVKQLATSLSRKWDLNSQIKRSTGKLMKEEETKTSMDSLKQKIATLNALNEKLKNQNIFFKERAEETGINPPEEG